MKYKIRYGGAMVSEEEIKAIVKTIRKDTRNWQAGLEARKMEKEASKFLGVEYGILTTSGSCAGLLALSALELPKGSEVIISAVTFPTLFNIILQCGLVPVVVDAEISTYNLDLDKVEAAISKKTKAIIAIHVLGNPVDMPKLMRIAKKYKLKVIEDNCDGWGSLLGEKKLGSFGDLSITSFHAAHIVSMGVGGAVFTSDKALAEKVRMYRDWGRQADRNKSLNTKWKELPKDYNPRFIYEKIGYNFQILELQAAMGRIQLRKAHKIKNLRKANFDYLVQELSQYPDLILPKTVQGADVCWFALPLTYRGDRGKLLRHLEKNGIETRPMFAGNITRHPAYKRAFFKKMNLQVSDYILAQSFWISVHPSLTKKELQYIGKVFKSFFNINSAVERGFRT